MEFPVKALLRLCTFFIVSSITCAAIGQSVNSSAIGFDPVGMYQHAEIDSVNMSNGNAVVHIPLFGYPQLGHSLSLTYSIIANTEYWQPNIVCYPDGSGGSCENTYVTQNFAYTDGINGAYPCGTRPSGSPAIQYLQSTTWCESIVPTYGGCDNPEPNGAGPPQCDFYLTGIFYVEEPTGEQRRLQYDSSNISLLRTTDGSGYLLQVPDSKPYYPYVCSGNQCQYKDISASILKDSKGVKLSGGTLTDPSGNVIQNSDGTVVDTIGRTIPPPPTQPATNDTSGCPTLNAAYQPAIGSATWTVPGPNGNPATYLFCFANVSFQTNFWGYGPQGHISTTLNGDGSITTNMYSESNYGATDLQSVVLPNGKFWGFVYDSSNPSDSAATAYGTLMQILTPEGGSISYKYDFTYDCGVYTPDGPVTIQRISQRTVTDARGNSGTWKYALAWPLDPNLYPLQTVETDPNKNDTAYGFTKYGCQALPAATVHYAGSYAQNNVLQTEKTTAYQTKQAVLPPYYQGTIFDGLTNYTNAFPQTVIRTDDLGDQSQTIYSYDPGFSVASPDCYIARGSYPANPIIPCNPEIYTFGGVSFGLQTGQSDYGYDGSLLRGSSTSYKWQGDPSFSTMNLLSAVDTTTTSDSSGQVAQTVYGYDGSGNQTSVKRWLNTNVSFLTTVIDYDSHGMPISVTDPMSNKTRTTYDSTGLFPSEIHRPTTNDVQHVDYYSYDTNTGNLLWHTDENGNSADDSAHTTHYTYADPLGRLTNILAPPSKQGQGESDVSYDDTALSVTTKIKADPDPSWSSTKEYDGLGRLVQVTAPNGATQETTYDWLNNVTSVTNMHFTTPSSTDGTTLFVYDPLGRKISQTASDGVSTQTWNYSGSNVDTHDESNSHTYKNVLDALGRVIDIYEDPDGANLHTHYVYDGLGNLRSVAQYGGSTTPITRTFHYDGLSRLTDSTNPETGTISYKYVLDDTSNALCAGDPSLPCRKTDARSVTTYYGYDSLDRLTSKTYSTSSTLSSCYLYDSLNNSGANTIGRLVAEWTQSGSSCSSTPPSSAQTLRKILSYDSVGRILQEQQCSFATCTLSLPYTNQYAYDLAGNETYFTNNIQALGVSKIYDGAGRLQSVLDDQIDKTTASYYLYNANSYWPHGAIQSFTLGIDPTVNRTYDSRLRVTSETAQHP
jgi:YD repeat-containing protein